jgi:hypothetical protein
MDPFRAGREGEEELFGFIRTDTSGAKTGGGEDGGAEDCSQFFNGSGPGMEPKQSEGAQTNVDGNDGGSEDVGPPEVYLASGESLHDAIIILYIYMY